MADPIEKGRRLGGLGVVLFSVPLLAMGIARVVSMLAFGESGATAPADAGSGEWVVTMATLVGVLPGVAGAALMVVALHLHGVRNRWLFWGALLPSILWAVLLFPWGVLGAVVMVSMFLWQLPMFFPAD